MAAMLSRSEALARRIAGIITGCIMRPLVLLLFFLGQPFWETKPPEKWTDAELDIVRHRSPWTQTVGPAPEVPVWLATAEPIEEAEGEARLRTRRTEQEPDP